MAKSDSNSNGLRQDQPECCPPEGGGGGKCQIDHRSGPGRRTRSGDADPSRLTSDPVLRRTAGMESSSRFRTCTSERMGHKPIEPRVGRWSAPTRGTDRRVQHESRRTHKGVGFGLSSGGPVWALGHRATPATSAYSHRTPWYRKGRRYVGRSVRDRTPRPACERVPNSAVVVVVAVVAVVANTEAQRVVTPRRSRERTRARSSRWSFDRGAAFEFTDRIEFTYEAETETETETECRG